MLAAKKALMPLEKKMRKMMTAPKPDPSSPAPATSERPPAPQTPDRVDTDLLELGDRRVVHAQRVAVSRRGMVATAHHRASAAGAEILADGGNAIDAAVAVAFALGVCEPAASGLGGQTTMLVHLAEPKRTFALDGSSRAPNRTAAGGFTRAERLQGYRATTVPSTPATLAWALREYGTLPLARVLEPIDQALVERLRFVLFPGIDVVRRQILRELNLVRGESNGLLQQFDAFLLVGRGQLLEPQ